MTEIKQKEIKEKIKKFLDELSTVDWIKILSENKIFIRNIGIGILFIFVLSLFVSAVKPTIKDQQLDAVSIVNADNKKVDIVKETNIKKAFDKKSSHIIAIIDAKNNPGFNEVDKLVTSKDPLQTINWKIDFIQPVYGFKKIANDYKLPAKNNFIVIENGKEKGRYSFDKLDNGLTTLEDKLNAIIEPKIARKQPKRTASDEKNSNSSSSTESSTRKKTEEVIFE